MAKTTELTVSPRDILGKATKKLRRRGIIPANIFGHAQESQAIQVEALAFDTLRRSHHATGIVMLRLDNAKQTQTALVRHVQRDPRSGKILHIDFLRVSLRDRITSKVPLRFAGEAPAIKMEGGMLLHLSEVLEVECAAGDIVEAIDVDVSGLEHIDDMIHAKAIELPRNFTLITDPEEVVVKIVPPRVEKVEEVAAPAEAASTEASTPAAESTEA